MQNLISFFVDHSKTPLDGEEKHIYAHLELYTDDGVRKTRVKNKEEIMEILKEESTYLRQYMFNSYNIRLEVDKEAGYINSFPFK